MMKRLNKKENLGITLIALVITIVILIILAGIIINVSLSDNGIFKKAKEASELSSISKYKEQIELVRTAKQMEKQGNATLEDLNVAFNDLNEKYWVNNAEIENGVIKLITNDGYDDSWFLDVLDKTKENLYLNCYGNYYDFIKIIDLYRENMLKKYNFVINSFDDIKKSIKILKKY